MRKDTIPASKTPMPAGVPGIAIARAAMINKITALNKLKPASGKSNEKSKKMSITFINHMNAVSKAARMIL